MRGTGRDRKRREEKQRNIDPIYLGSTGLPAIAGTTKSDSYIGLPVHPDRASRDQVWALISRERRVSLGGTNEVASRNLNKEAFRAIWEIGVGIAWSMRG